MNDSTFGARHMLLTRIELEQPGERPTVMVHPQPCEHPRAYVVTSPTTGYPPPALYCGDCGLKLATVEQAKMLLAAVA